MDKRVVFGVAAIVLVAVGFGAGWLVRGQMASPSTPEGASAAGRKGRTPDEAAKAAHSKLYREFKTESLLSACRVHFDQVDGHGMVGGIGDAGFTTGESPDTYKLFSAEGTISQDKLKQLLAALKADLHEWAKASGAEKVGEPSDKIGDRPISVMRAMSLARPMQPGTVCGFYITYSDGNVVGAIDVMAMLNSGASDHWLLICAVHELTSE